jgi:3-deoxy-D-manno-octulosonic-acid transferase
MTADIAGYVPYDIPGAVRHYLDALAPDALVFSRGDIWPELATQAHRRQTLVGIIGGTVRPHSGRLGWPVRRLTRPGYEVVHLAGAVSEADATRLGILGVSEDRVRILGDPRYDGVMETVRSTSSDDPLLSVSAGAPTLVAGSTWPADEEVLLHAFAGLRNDYPAARLILVPHQPTGSSLKKVEGLAQRLGCGGVTRLGAGPPRQWRILVVDRVGVLARIYGSGTMAYVGGGFGRAGLHSVIEPAAWGRPVLFGPRWMESRDARLLIRLGGGADLPKGRTPAIQRLTMYWRTWLDNEVARQRVGQKARAIVEQELGAAARCASLVQELVAGRS